MVKSSDVLNVKVSFGKERRSFLRSIVLLGVFIILSVSSLCIFRKNLM
jgi:hypothetical protein